MCWAIFPISPFVFEIIYALVFSFCCIFASYLNCWLLCFSEYLTGIHVYDLVVFLCGFVALLCSPALPCFSTGALYVPDLHLFRGSVIFSFYGIFLSGEWNVPLADLRFGVTKIWDTNCVPIFCFQFFSFFSYFFLLYMLPSSNMCNLIFITCFC